MKPLRFERKWSGVEAGRECGSCYACCIYLGITELKKHGGKACKHLSATTDPNKRCSIYSSRPHACSNYECLWKSGVGPDDMRPSESGMLITPYLEDGVRSISIVLFDRDKAGNRVGEVITELLMTGFEVRLIDYTERTALLFRDGKTFRCKLLSNSPGSYESLNFVTDGEPIARYHLQTETDKCNTSS
jgi:hypothetical protein